MRKLIVLIVLLMLALPSQGGEHGQGSRNPGGPGRGVHRRGEHPACDHRQLAQNRYYVAVCSKNDLRQAFATQSEAFQAAQAHSRATGHKTGVIKE
ncbi:MAG: hypothetical protein HY319_01765 [Armatimonadetes bacterium]|nr:hypothetical protein [Armatimonadota bacterium]